MPITTGAGSLRTADATAPTVPSTLTAVAGPTASSEITVSGLAGIADGVSGVASVTVKYGTSSDVALAFSQTLTSWTDSTTLTGLAEYTLYYIWATATDFAGNAAAAVPISTGAGSLRTADVTTPTGMENVTLAAGADPQSQIVVSNLNAITDGAGSGVATISVFYSTKTPYNPAFGGQVAAVVGNDAVTLSALKADTRYYVWVSAADFAGNATGKVSVSGGSLLTTDTAAPTGLAGATVDFGVDPETTIYVYGFDSFADNSGSISTVSVYYGTADDYTQAIKVTGIWSENIYAQHIINLKPGTRYYVWTEAVDAKGNKAGPTPVATNNGYWVTADYAAPTGLGSVTAAEGPVKNSEITVGNLAAITDNSGVVASVTLKYCTNPNVMLASSKSVTPGTDSVTLTGLTEYTRYYIWTTAADNAGNVATDTPIATNGGSFTTADATAPTGLGTVTAAAGTGA